MSVAEIEIEVEVELENVLDRNGLSRKVLKIKVAAMEKKRG